MYKVFIENKPVLFTTQDNHEELSLLRTNDFTEVQQRIREIDFIPDVGIAVVSKEPERLFRQTFESYKKIEAAGGLVFKNSHILLIYRLGMWDLPKGKLEKNEEPHVAAVREIEEECGIHGHRIVQRLQDSFHTYHFKEKDVLKRTFWYLMIYEGAEEPVPQTEEDITDVRWVALSDLDDYRSQMYPSLLPIVDECLELIKNGMVFENGSTE